MFYTYFFVFFFKHHFRPLFFSIKAGDSPPGGREIHYQTEFPLCLDGHKIPTSIKFILLTCSPVIIPEVFILICLTLSIIAGVAHLDGWEIHCQIPFHLCLQ